MQRKSRLVFKWGKFLYLVYKWVYEVTAGHRKAFIFRTYYPTTCNTCCRWQLSTDIHIQIFQTDLHTFP